jgi:hypothetical protein
MGALLNLSLSLILVDPKDINPINSSNHNMMQGARRSKLASTA